MAAAVPLSFATWSTLLNNFAVQEVGMNGAQVGLLQSLREVPGFLAFGVVFLLFVMREQTVAVIALALLGLGTAATGFFPSPLGLYVTTVIMSIGFHYFETVNVSLTLQWVEERRAPEVFGRLIAIGSIAGIASFALVWLGFSVLGADFRTAYAVGGGLTVAIAVLAVIAFPRYPEQVRQHRQLILRSRYWLYYALTFLSGARRQIFMVFAGLLMVEKFGYSVRDMAALFLLNGLLNAFLATRIGRLIGRVGERRALIFEYVGLVGVFVAYAFVESALLAGILYLVDHLFFALAIAIKTYFQKIADTADIASTAGVSFTINHIAAVVIPALFGVLWLHSTAAVFLAGAAMAGMSAVLAFLVPRTPMKGNETTLADGGRNSVGAMPAGAPAAE